VGQIPNSTERISSFKNILKCFFCLLQDIIQKVKQSTNYASLLEYDQLLKLQHNKEALVGFSKSIYVTL